MLSQFWFWGIPSKTLWYLMVSPFKISSYIVCRVRVEGSLYYSLSGKLNFLFVVLLKHVSTQEEGELWLSVEVSTNICWGEKPLCFPHGCCSEYKRPFSQVFMLSGRTVSDLRNMLITSSTVKQCQISHVDSIHTNDKQCIPPPTPHTNFHTKVTAASDFVLSAFAGSLVTRLSSLHKWSYIHSVYR